MPRARKPTTTHTEWAQLSASSDERADCAVIAVAAACNRPYGEVKALMARLGRKANRGTNFHITEAAIRELGMKLTVVSPRKFIDRYPGNHRNHRNVTTHHPDRFPRVWMDGKTYLLKTPSHILCIKNGRNLDWTRGRSFRAKTIYEVTT